MPIIVTKIEFRSKDDAGVKSFFEKAGAIGYVAKYDKHWLALILNDERVIEEMRRQSFFIGEITRKDLTHIKTGPFRGLNFVTPKPARKSSNIVHIDGITANGLIKGWGWSSDEKPCCVNVTVDAQLIGKFSANKFRIDLLNEGIGTGCHAFSNRLPDWVLDGKSHNLLVELVALDDPDDRVLAKAEKVAKFPFHFNLQRPWVGSGKDHAYTWTSSNEADYLDIRSSIIGGDGFGAITRASKFISLYPHAIFLDFGVKDFFINNDDIFQTFRYRLRRRWGEHFGRSTCHLGEQCCKKLNLPYNEESSQKISKINPIFIDKPWDLGGFLDRCPMPIRHFASKKLTVEFAHKMKVRVPKTLGVIRSINDFDKFDFPSRYVLKPDYASGTELYLMCGDINLFDGFEYSKESIRARVSNFINGGEGREFIVEEFIQQENTGKNLPIIPLDYKFHCFGGKARIIHVDDKNAISRDTLHRRQSWLARDWSHSPASFRSTGEHPNESIQRPSCLSEMIKIVDRLASNIKDYVRVDFYASPEGPVLGEITSYSHSGLGFSEYGDIIMGQAWEIFSPSI